MVFEGEELGAVGGVGGGGVVEWEEEGVVVWHPEEARGLDAEAHGDAVGDHGADVGLVEDPGGVVRTLAGFDGGAGGAEGGEARGGERRVEADVVEGEPGVG